MAQIFHPSTNVISKLSIVGLVLGVPALGTAAYFTNMTYSTQVNVPREQPVPFSHKHHVGDDGIDCRYCHSSVDKGPFAGLPSTHTCMTCHSQIWVDSPLLEPVRASFRTRTPMQWTRVHDLPDFAYFDHSIHVKKGVSCVSCHGRIDEQPLVMKEKPLTMQWCLDCHRDPAKNLRPREHVYDLSWTPKENQRKMGERLVQEYHVLSSFQLTNCSTCHR
jgi:hypothetical protein